MLTFKFFVFVGICASLINSIKNSKKNKTKKNLALIGLNVLLLIIGVAILIDAMM